VSLETGEPIISDVVLSLSTGWTPQQIESMDAKFVEKLILYLNLTGEKTRNLRSDVKEGYRKIFSSEDGLVG
jgi:hypothetical protein